MRDRAVHDRLHGLLSRTYVGYNESEACTDWARAEQLVVAGELSRAAQLDDDEPLVEDWADGLHWKLRWRIAEHYSLASYEWHFCCHLVGRPADLKLARLMTECIAREIERLAGYKRRRSTRIELSNYREDLASKALTLLARTRAQALSEADGGDRVTTVLRERFRRARAYRDALHPDLVQREAAPPMLPYSPTNTLPPNRIWQPPSDD